MKKMHTRNLSFSSILIYTLPALLQLPWQLSTSQIHSIHLGYIVLFT